MDIFNQPFDGKFGDFLSSKMQGNYTELTLMAAFAKNSGVLRLRSDILDFRKNGGKVKAFIGLDADGTSYEAVLNLFYICDEVYVIHSENNSSTFHSKIYTISNNNYAIVSIGSSNLTADGMWTNFESNSIIEYDLNDTNHSHQYNKLMCLISRYSDASYVCSKNINSIEDIDKLLVYGYLSKEITQKMKQSERYNLSSSTKKSVNLFGSEKISLPKLPNSSQETSIPTDNINITPSDTLDSNNLPAFSNEQFWFEMRASTGGSRNILDLSMNGKIIEGSVANTKYETADNFFMMGGVTFFDINPNDHSIIKDITINFDGRDYFPSTLLFASNNGSWRLQLKGDSLDSIPLSRYGNSFVYKILVFEKINSDYYVLSILEQGDSLTVNRNKNFTSQKIFFVFLLKYLQLYGIM